jgi:SIS domain-containing protein
MSDISLIFDRAIDDSIRTLKSLKKLESGVAKAADLIGQCLLAGNKLLIRGNDGSAADAAHFVTELVVRFAKDRSAHPAFCLASDGSLLTAAANDYGFDEVFARQVAAFGQSGRCAHLPYDFGPIEKCRARARGSESAQTENDRASWQRRRINYRHGRYRSSGAQ